MRFDSGGREFPGTDMFSLHRSLIEMQRRPEGGFGQQEPSARHLSLGNDIYARLRIPIRPPFLF